jgi:hypothetical protein
MIKKTRIIINVFFFLVDGGRIEYILLMKTMIGCISCGLGLLGGRPQDCCLYSFLN